MAVNKTAGVTKVKLGSSTKKAAVLKKAASQEGRRSQEGQAPRSCALKSQASALKKAALKKAAGPKLTAPQHELLKRVVAHKDAKATTPRRSPSTESSRPCSSTRWSRRARSTLRRSYFHYQVSTIGKKYLESGTTPKS